MKQLAFLKHGIECIEVVTDFELCMVVWGIARGLIGLVASFRFKMLDCQPEKSNMGLVPIDVHHV